MPCQLHAADAPLQRLVARPQARRLYDARAAACDDPAGYTYVAPSVTMWATDGWKLATGESAGRDFDDEENEVYIGRERGLLRCATRSKRSMRCGRISLYDKVRRSSSSSAAWTSSLSHARDQANDDGAECGKT